MIKESTIIKGGLLIDPASGISQEQDLLISTGKVEAVDRPGAFDQLKDAQVLDAQGKWVTPGFIDLHVHLREPGFEWKETIKTGTQAAVLGGFTSVCSMPNTRPTNDSREVTEFILKQATTAAAARVHPIGSVSIGLIGKELSPFSELQQAGCVAFSDDGEPVYDAGLMRRALEWCLMLDLPIACHEEDKCLSCSGVMNESSLSTRLGLKGWPAVAEEVMIARDIELARTTGARVHICHVSTARGVELIRRAKNDQIRITAEVTPHHLLLTEQAVGQYDTNAKMSPPLRKVEDCQALLAGLKDGTIDAIASDHAPHDFDSKQIEFGKAAFGILGLQTSLPLVLEFVKSGEITKERAIELLSSGPAKTFSLPYGKLTRGSSADLVILDPKHSWNFEVDQVKSISKNSPFLGRKLEGIAESVMIGGRIVLRGRELCCD